MLKLPSLPGHAQIVPDSYASSLAEQICLAVNDG